MTDVPWGTIADDRPPRLRPQEAIAIAKDGLKALFKDEPITNLGLEEVEYDPRGQHWNITLGFSRPWNEVQDALTLISGQTRVERSLKTVQVSDARSNIVSVKNKPPES